MIHLTQLVQSDSEYLMLDRQIISPYLLDKLAMSIKYCSADVYNTYIVYSPADIRCHVLIDIMSEYYLCYYRVLGLNGVHEDECGYPDVQDILFGMGEMLGHLHLRAGYDAPDVEFVMGGASFTSGKSRKNLSPLADLLP